MDTLIADNIASVSLREADTDPEALRRATHKLDLLIRKNRNGECRDVSLWCSIGHSAIRD